MVWLRAEDPWWVTGVVAVAAMTDVLDGRVARYFRERRLAHGDSPGRVGQAYALGSWLDPLCDKAFVVSTIGAIAFGLHPPALLLLLILSRELLLAPLVAAYGLSSRLRQVVRYDFRAGRTGKLATIAQFAALASLLFWPASAWHTAAIAGGLGVVATIVYVRRAMWMARWIGENGLLYEHWLEAQKRMAVRATTGRRLAM